MKTSASTCGYLRERAGIRFTCAFISTLLLVLAGSPRLRAGTTQSLILQPGWNAVYLEVDPADRAPGNVFAGVPLASAWTRAEPLLTAQFIQNPEEVVFNTAEWLRYVPGQPEFINTLRAVAGYRVYLLKLNSGPFTWRVTGTAGAAVTRWVPDVYNLRSFPVDPSAPPTFKSFLQSSSAHFDVAQDRLRGVYRLDSSGRWVVAVNNDTISPGTAYWIFCQGASSFTAPLALTMNTGVALDFGEQREQATLRFENLGAGVRAITLRQTGAFTPGVLAWRRSNAANIFEWVDLPSAFSLAVTNGRPQQLVLAVRRSRMPAADYSSVLEVLDAQGTRYVVPVTANRVGDGYAGLWVGTVSVNAVSEPHFGSLVTNVYALVNGQPTPLDDAGLTITTNRVVSTNANAVLVTNEFLVAQTISGEPAPIYSKVERNVTAQTPTPTRGDFNMRAIIHVDATGRARLLKEVVQMWRDGTYTNNSEGMRVSDKPGSYVFLSRDALLSQFKGVALREGASVGRRIAAIGFDFDGKGTNDMALFGEFGPGHSLTNEIRIESDYPLNPFRHKYHPDHDNLDARYEPIMDPANAESYAVTRAFRFEFAASSSNAGGSPDSAYSEVEGIYRETLSGLHKQPINVQGTFKLSRASFISELNPSPTP